MEEIDLKELFNVFWCKKVFIIVVILLFACIGVVYSNFFVKPDYKATSTIVLTKNGSDDGKITQTEVTLNQKLVATYTEVIRSTGVLRQAISNLQADVTEEQLKNSIDVKAVANSQLIEISVKNENPETAQILANEVTKVLIEKVKEIYKMENISIVDEAKLPNAPYNVNHKKDVLMFTIIGAVLAFGIVFVLSLFDTTIKNADEIERNLGLNVLVSIPNYNYNLKKKGNK